MGKSAAPSSAPIAKPVKPYSNFPLTPHAKGWCKKYHGKVRMVCGPLPPDQALRELADKIKEWDAEDGIASAPPPPPSDDILIVDLADEFLDAKEVQIGTSLEQRTFAEYEEAIRDFVSAVGPSRPVAHLGPADFQRHRLSLSTKFGVHRQKKFQIMVRSLFKWAAENRRITFHPQYGTEYRLPSKRAMRVSEAERQNKNGRLMFSPAEIRALLDNASTNMKAMILLALNGGYGQDDLSELPVSVVDLKKGVIEYARPKTGIRRRTLLWKDTIEAIHDSVRQRPKPSEPQFLKLLFLTRWGSPYIRDTQTEREDGEIRTAHKDQCGMQFYHLCKAAKIYKPGRNFYSLRRTFRTLADQCGDQRAIALIMGHELEDMGTVYVEDIGDDRIKRITDYVYSCLFPKKAQPARRKAR